MFEKNPNYNKIKFKKGDLVLNKYQPHKDKFKPYLIFIKLTKRNYVVYDILNKDIHCLGRESKYGNETQTLIPVTTCYNEYETTINVLDIINNIFGKANQEEENNE